MNKILKTFSLIGIAVIIFTLFSCTGYDPHNQEAPSDLIPQKEFTNILIDVRLTEVIIRQDVSENNGNDVDSITSYYYNFVFKKHNISQEEFQNSLYYYTNVPKIFDEINNAVVDSLNIMKELIKNPELIKHTEK
ncbi:MAG: DUF4296 domain-containing protein [Bacteroidales bacterium]|nr:DUF4296 domain-containing protein [Bacteroidales bacterium]